MSWVGFVLLCLTNSLLFLFFSFLFLIVFLRLLLKQRILCLVDSVFQRCYFRGGPVAEPYDVVLVHPYHEMRHRLVVCAPLCDSLVTGGD